MPRAKNIKKRGTWSSHEDENLKRLVSIHGEGHWSKIAQHLNEECGMGEGLNGRIGKQCRERWLHHLQPGICHHAWSEAEAAQLVSLHKLLGNHFSAIAKYLPGRTENSCKNFWNATRRCKAPDTKARAIVKAYLDASEQNQHQPSPQQQRQQQQQQEQKHQPLQSSNLDLHTKRNSNSSSSSSCCSSGGRGGGSNKDAKVQQEGQQSASTPSHSSDSSSLHDFCPPPRSSVAAVLRPSAQAQPIQPRQPQPQSHFLQSLQHQLIQLQQQRQAEIWLQQQQQQQYSLCSLWPLPCIFQSPATSQVPQPMLFPLAPLLVPPPAVPYAAPHGLADPDPRHQDQVQQPTGRGGPAVNEAPELSNDAQHAAQLHLRRSKNLSSRQSSQPVGQEELEAAAVLAMLPDGAP